jgi:hypothetical protein
MNASTNNFPILNHRYTPHADKPFLRVYAAGYPAIAFLLLYPDTPTSLFVFLFIRSGV